VPELWGGVTMRGSEEGGELTRQSAEIGALLVDLEVALAAGDAERAAELAGRMAAIMDEAGFLDPELATLRQAIESPVDQEALSSLRLAVPTIEIGLRERFDVFRLELGMFAEQARIAAATGERAFLATKTTRQYAAWAASQSEDLPAAAVGGLQVLSRSDSSPSLQASAAATLLRSLTR
jgi:hypothetical protein